MPEEEKVCCLTLDEMSISQRLEFDVRSGSLIGEALFHIMMDLLPLHWILFWMASPQGGNNQWYIISLAILPIELFSRI